jgi:hypothetical protein
VIHAYITPHGVMKRKPFLEHEKACGLLCRICLRVLRSTSPERKISPRVSKLMHALCNSLVRRRTRLGSDVAVSTADSFQIPVMLAPFSSGADIQIAQ